MASLKAMAAGVAVLARTARIPMVAQPGSAAYKGIYALLLKEGAADWRTGVEGTVQNYFDAAIDIHHVFPKDWCQKQGIDAKRLDSIVNKTPLSARTNRAIGGRAPSEYLPRVANGADITLAALAENVRTHLVDPACLSQLRRRVDRAAAGRARRMHRAGQAGGEDRPGSRAEVAPAGGQAPAERRP